MNKSMMKKFLDSSSVSVLQVSCRGRTPMCWFLFYGLFCSLLTLLRQCCNAAEQALVQLRVYSDAVDWQPWSMECRPVMECGMTKSLEGTLQMADVPVPL